MLGSNLLRKGVIAMNKVLKVISAALLSASIVASVAISASAVINSNEQKILDALNTTANLNGNPTKIPTEYYNQAENYFNRSDVEITSAEADEIVKKINDVKTYIESTGVSKWSELNDAQIATIVEKSNDVVAVVDLKLTYNKSAAVGKKVTVIKVDKNNGGNNGNGGNGGKIGDNGGPIKDTGFGVADAAVVPGLGIILVTAAGVYLLKTSKKDEVR